MGCWVVFELGFEVSGPFFSLSNGVLEWGFFYVELRSWKKWDTDGL